VADEKRTAADGAERATGEINLIPADLKYEDSFSINTVLAALFVGLIMLPGAMYMGLVAGVGLGGAAEWVTVILFLEVARRIFVTMRAQEIMLIYWAAAGIIGVSGVGGSLGLFNGSFSLFIWEQYLIQHPLLKNLAPKIPDWVVPASSTGVYALRTFFHKAWVMPVLVGMVVALLYRVNSVTLGYLLFRTTADAERLPFPMAKINVGGTLALAESSSGREGWRWRVFSIGAMIGVGWGLVYVVVPVLTSVIAPQPIMLLPIPWIDLTQAIHAFLPGALLGLSTGLWGVFFGMVLPAEIAWGSVAGSMIGCILIPPILVMNGMLPDWKPGFTTIPTSFALYWNFQISFGIGVALVFGWGGIAMMVKQVLKERRARRMAEATADYGLAPVPVVEKRGLLHRLRLPSPPPDRGDFNPGMCLILWAGSVLIIVLIVRILVPEFPVWIAAVFGLIWSPLNSYITARMVGITGSSSGSPFPFLREMTFILSGYKGVALWFAPVPLYDHGWEVSTYKSLELAKVKFISLVKLITLTTFLVIILSFLYWSVIWKLGPIPSASYPFAQKMWPLWAQNQYVWLSITDPLSPQRDYFIHQVLNYKFILAGFGLSLALWGATSLARLPYLFFFSLIGSMTMWPHDAIPMAIGALIGIRMGRKYGNETWQAYTPILSAGFACGMGLIGMVAVAITLMARAVTPLLY